jgi:hypothetical protein
VTATIRSLVRDIQVEVRDTDLTPDRAAELVTKLAALFGSVLDEVRRTELAYCAAVRDYALDGTPIARAETLAKGTPAFEAWRLAKDTEKLTTQLLSSLKAMLRAKAEEMRFTR